MNARLRKQFQRVRLFLCDVDGVLTDGTVMMGSGMEMKAFHVWDGLGMRFLQRYGVKVGWVSRRASGATSQRAQDLKIDYLRQIEGSKVTAVEALLAETGFQWEQVCYVGDDVVDLGVLKRSGVAVAVGNAIPAVKKIADCVTRKRGGDGAVREVVEWILQAQGHWAQLVKEHLE